MKVNTNLWNRLRYDLYAPVYDLIARPFDRGRRRSFELVDLQPDEKVLIAGVGTGLDLEHLPKTVEVTAVDLSPKMLQRAAERAHRLGLTATFSVGSAHELDAADDTFDVVVLHLVLAVIPDPLACIRETARVLKRGGRLAIFDKFLPDNTRPSLLRRGIGVIANVLFSDINRQLGPMLDSGGFTVVRQEPSVFGGAYLVAIVEKKT